MAAVKGSEPARGDDSAWTTARTLATPAAKLFSEWTLLAQDLRYALRRAQLWKDFLATSSGSDQDAEICVSLIRDAVISMVSCFDKRSPVYLDPSVVYASVPGGLEYFSWLKDMRDNWIAHRSGPHRQCSVVIVVDEKSGEFQGFGHLSHMYNGPKLEASDDLIRMMTIALEYTVKEAKIHEESTRGDVQKLRNFERINLPRAQTIVPGSSEIHMGRKKFRNIKNNSKRKGR